MAEMEAYKKVYKFLDDLNIIYKVVEHPAVVTTEEADKFIEGLDGICSKSLFMCNNKKTQYFLVVMDDKKRLDIKKLGEIIGEKGIKFASKEKLMEKLGLTAGSVSIFGLLNNAERDVKVYFDKPAVGESIINFHPNDNTKTLFIAIEDMYKYFEAVECEYQQVDL